MHTKKLHRCSDCGKLENSVVVRVLDAADHVHWFHPRCWRALRRWLAGHDD